MSRGAWLRLPSGEMVRAAIAVSAFEAGGPMGPRRPVTKTKRPSGDATAARGSKTPTPTGEDGTRVSAPSSGATEKTETEGAVSVESRLVASRNLPSGVSSRPVGWLPPAGVSPSSAGVPSAPIANRVIVSSPVLATYAC